MKGALAKLPLHDKEGDVLAVIEVSAGSRNKFKHDSQLGAFVLNKVLPVGTAFPCDFGYLPQTLGDDGDPLDVFVLTDEPLPVGTVAPVRIVGLLEAEQTEQDETVRNDRLLAVAVCSQCYAGVENVEDLDDAMLDQIDAFFVCYESQAGKTYAPLGRRGAKHARKAIERGIKTAQDAR
jgi:inorganic pyrophosphatase